MKEYIRYCDVCKSEIKKLYDYGVTTLYRNIRVGRGHMIKDYEDNHILNLVEDKTPNDYDSYGRGWKQDESKEFSFCCPECLFVFLRNIYEDTYNSSLKDIKERKKEDIDIGYKEFIKKYGEKISFFRRIQTKFSKGFFRQNLLEEIKKMKKQLNKIETEVKSSSKKEKEKQV